MEKMTWDKMSWGQTQHGYRYCQDTPHVLGYGFMNKLWSPGEAKSKTVTGLVDSCGVYPDESDSRVSLRFTVLPCKK